MGTLFFVHAVGLFLEDALQEERHFISSDGDETHVPGSKAFDQKQQSSTLGVYIHPYPTSIERSTLIRHFTVSSHSFEGRRHLLIDQGFVTYVVSLVLRSLSVSFEQHLLFPAHLPKQIIASHIGVTLNTTYWTRVARYLKVRLQLWLQMFVLVLGWKRHDSVCFSPRIIHIGLILMLLVLKVTVLCILKFLHYNRFELVLERPLCQLSTDRPRSDPRSDLQNRDSLIQHFCDRRLLSEGQISIQISVESSCDDGQMTISI